MCTSSSMYRYLRFSRRLRLSHLKTRRESDLITTSFRDNMFNYVHDGKGATKMADPYDAKITDSRSSVMYKPATMSPRLVTCGVPQGLVLDPLLFCTKKYKKERITEAYGILHHFNADDIQFYFCEPSRNR